mgnify:CR=1 FL=1
MTSALLVAASLGESQLARASHFEFCELYGTIASEPVALPQFKASVSLAVTSVRKRQEFGIESYTDCTEYIGKSIAVDLSRPTFGTPRMRAGDSLAVYRSVIADIAGNYHVKVTLVSYQRRK